jgi:hypothetical protein
MAVHGSTTHFALDNSGGSSQDLTAHARGVDFTLDQSMHDITTFGNSARVKTVGLKDGKFSVTFVSSTTILSHLNGLYTAQTPGTSTTWSFIIGPRGSTGGFEKYSGEAILTGIPVPTVVDDVEMITASFEVTGAVTIGTF